MESTVYKKNEEKLYYKKIPALGAGISLKQNINQLISKTIYFYDAVIKRVTVFLLVGNFFSEGFFVIA